MKKLMMMVLSAFLMLGVVSTSAFADAAKGQKYYLKFMKKKTGMTGGAFAIKHTTAEWDALFADGGAKFIEKYSKEYPELEKFFTGDKFKEKYMQDIADFLKNYSKDSGNVPSC
ncbi:MAG: hypothetical protein PWQ42_522 [Sulfurospirillum sp.]|jgi:hypothetical protein|nr:hypothetical protein [Sulfurospirillum sp.]